MAVDSPANIAILGAGPMGLESALYARFLGYDVQLYETGDVAQSIIDWQHITMFSPFSMNSTPLGLAAILAQFPEYPIPDGDAILTGRALIDQYLKPLSKTDLIAGSIHTQTRVVSVGRQGFTKQTGWGSDKRSEQAFCLLLKSSGGQERIETSDIVIDTTGTYGNHKFFGDGGIPAVGESSLSDIYRRVPDLLGKEKDEFVNRHTLVIGSGFSAATSIADLSLLVDQYPETQVTWLVRNVKPDGPIRKFDNDPLVTRDKLSALANRIALSNHSRIRVIDGANVRSVSKKDTGQFHVVLEDSSHAELDVDQIISNVGYRPDNSIFQELQVHQCYVTEGPMNLAAALMGNHSVDCLDQQSHGAASLITSEPHFYVLGSKSYGRTSNFLLSIGHAQIRDLFSIIADRQDLDLYKTISALPK